jgi:hypothetical protein
MVISPKNLQYLVLSNKTEVYKVEYGVELNAINM